MLRRRILVSAVVNCPPVASASQRQFRLSSCRLLPYLPPGRHAPPLPWFRETPTNEMTQSSSEGTSQARGITMDSSFATTLDAILDATASTNTTSNIPNPATTPTAAAMATATVSATVRAVADVVSGATSGGPLRVTATRRMPVLAGPTLDTRIHEIVNMDHSIASEMLPDVVKLLIDPQAEGVENVSFTDFVSMQPRRQLAALSGKKSWHDWLLDSAHYKQISRLQLESPFYDMRALQNAGVTTLYQWAERPNLVKVSSSTRGLLDAAVDKSVEAYVHEVTKVVNTANETYEMLVTWTADIIGKFVLDTLRISLDQLVTPIGGNFNRTNTISQGNGDVTADAERAAISAMGDVSSRPNELSPGRVCTLDHYHRLARKILASVRKEYVAQRHGTDAMNGKILLDNQAEAEIREKAYATLSDALMRVLETNAATMPSELHALRDYGFLALDRVPDLLRQAASVLQLQTVPVRYFVFHSTGERERSDLEHLEADLMTESMTHTNNASGISLSSAAAAASSSSSSSSVAAGMGGGVALANATGPASTSIASPTLMSGVFLTGTSNFNVTLGEWLGQAVPGIAHPCDTVQNEYLSVLHRLKRHTTRVGRTTLVDVLKGANQFRHGFNAAEALGLQQLFGPAKLVEDRLASVLNSYYNSTSSSKPIHFIEAGHTCGKTSVLERLSRRTVEGGRNAVIVRYSGTATPFVAGLDDHPLAFASRFWFRVVLASCPYLIRTEELFTRAPKSVMWWANKRNWSWELYQKLVRLQAGREGTSCSLHAILVDDIDRVLDSMEVRFIGGPNGSSMVSRLYAPIHTENEGAVKNAKGEAATGEGHRQEGKSKKYDTHSSVLSQETTNALSYSQGVNNNHYHDHHHHHHHLASSEYGGSSDFFSQEVVDAAVSKVTVAIGQLDMVFTGHRVSRILLSHVDTPVRRYFIPLANGIGLQQRLRVLPLVSALYALHQRSRLEFSGLTYEVLKNCPGLLGYMLGVFWSGRAAQMDLRGGAPRLMQWSGTHPQLRSFIPSELFAELPQRNYLLKNLPAARLRLVELLQRQLSSPTGYLTTGVDTTLQDERDGILVPHNHTTSQVHPFALFTIFSQQDPLESPREANVVRAWGEVWAEYCAVVNTMGTTSERKRDALRVLLHGALLLRAVAVSGAQMDLNLKIPAYGFPLLASDTRLKQKGSGPEPVVAKATPDIVRKATSAYKTFFTTTEQAHFPFRPSVGLNGGCDVVSLSGTTLALYDLVTTAEGLQNINYRFAEALLGVLHCLSKHVLPPERIRQVHYVTVVSIDHVSSLAGSFTTMATMSSASASSASSLAGVAAGTATAQLTPVAADDVFAPPPTPVVPYFLDLSAVFEDDVIDRMRSLQETLGIDKEFRTLNDLLDDLESTYRVYVHQDVVASQAELESLLSPTLMQLVPDATTLPAYTAEVISPDTLLMDALLDDEEIVTGAEVEEVRREAALAQEEPLATESFADAEHVRESAELLEAMLNEAVSDSAVAATVSRQEHISNANTQAALLSDVAAEDAVGNNMPAVGATGFAGNDEQPQPQQEDALAWLHDVLTPATGDESGLTVRSKLSGAPAGGRGTYELLSNEEEEVADPVLAEEEEEEVVRATVRETRAAPKSRGALAKGGKTARRVATSRAKPQQAAKKKQRGGRKQPVAPPAAVSRKRVVPATVPKRRGEHVVKKKSKEQAKKPKRK